MKKMDVILGISNKHIHLTKEDYEQLFGKEEKLEVDRYLLQPEQFASLSYVDIKTEKNRIKHVRVLGPLRSYTQLEISKTDAYFLGIQPPIADSGELENASTVEIIGPNSSITRKCAIIPNRHIHISPEQKKEMGLEDVSEVDVYFPSEKETTFHNVKLKVVKDAVLELHLDTDDANGAFLKTGMKGRIKKQSIL